MKAAALLPLVLLLGAAPPRSELVVTVETRSAGEATVCLWSGHQGFPNCQKGKPFKQQIVAISQGRTSVRFDDVPDGRYAVSVALDANGNGKIDTNFLGIPREPFGVSGKRPGFGKPSFSDAAFQHPSQPTIVLLSR